MCRIIGKIADAACLASAAALVVLVGAKGLGFNYPESLQFWVLQAMHLFFAASFGLGLFSAVRSRDRGRTVAYSLPFIAFAAAFAAAAASVSIPAPLLIVFDLYLVVVCSMSLFAPPRAALPAQAAPSGVLALRPPRFSDYREIPAAEAYALLNTGGLLLVCTKGADGRYDVAPIAWSCPLDYEPTSRVLIVLDPSHRTSVNIETAKAFTLALPTFLQRKLVEDTGSVSGGEVDKYKKFGIKSLSSAAVDTRVPEGVAGYLECRLIEARRLGTVAVYAAEVVRAVAVPDAWRYRLHYAGDAAFYRPGENVGVEL